MVTSSIIANTDQRVFNLLQPEHRPKLQRRKKNDRDVAQQLVDVIQARRPALRLRSRSLDTCIWFVNEKLTDPEDQRYDGKVITMEMLAELLSCESSMLEAAQRLIGTEKGNRNRESGK